MSFVKRTLSNVAGALLGTVALFVLGGCGGETGGGVSGIAGALTNARVRVSSFNLATTAPINTLVEVGTTTRATGVTGIDGALYPTRNSRSFRVLLKGAGSNREDIIYYYDTYDPDLDPTAPGHAVTPDDYQIHPATNEEPWDLTVPAHDGLPRTELRKLYFAKRDGLGDQVVAVFKRPEVSPAEYVYEEDGVVVPTAGVGAVKVYEAESGAYSYSQITASRPVRTGRRNVIVQFFSGSAAAAKTAFEVTIPGAASPGDEETAFLTNNLTNSYVFTTLIPPRAKEISLTSSFQANNGDNGLVDSGNLTLIANGLPARWGSVKFEAYEENYGFGKPSIVFSKIVNLNDVQHAGAGDSPTFGQVVARNLPAPSSVSASGKDTYVAATDAQDLTVKGGFPFANRQRVLRVYATCYELPDASGAILAQTLENGTTYNDNAGLYPVQFISTPLARADLFFPTPGTTLEAETALTNLRLSPAISNVSATVPPIAQEGSQKIVVTGSSVTFPRYAYNAEPPGGVTTLTRTLSNAGFAFVISNAADTAAYKSLPGVLNPPSLPSATEPGELTWNETPNPAKFSQKTYAPRKPATFIRFRNYFGGGFTDFPAELVPNQGTAGGVIQ